jgi:hypothetical protein
VPSGVPAAVTWDVLIPTIPHRHSKLVGLLAEFDRQWQPGFGVRVLRDNLRLGHVRAEFHRKRQDLLESSRADYVCDVDDDDWIAPDYVSSIMSALASRPDYVGFLVDCEFNGNPWRKASHSLEHQGYSEIGIHFFRDITHLNPIRRELALLSRWDAEVADDDWSAAMRATGKVKTQVMIAREMYFYRCSTTDRWHTDREPSPEPLPELPEYPWLTVIS